jgi:hypothetical protein
MAWEVLLFVLQNALITKNVFHFTKEKQLNCFPFYKGKANKAESIAVK